MDLLVGVDIGTTQLKVGVFDANGVPRACAARPCAPEYGANGSVSVHPDVWWGAFSDAFAACLEALDPSAIRAIGVGSQAQTYVLLDAAGRPLGPAVSWLEESGDTGGLPGELSDEDVYFHTGLARPVPTLTRCKLRRFGDDPRAWSDVSRVVFADGMLMYRLTGRAAVSRNLASMAGLYSMQHGEWWAPAVEAARVPVRALPALCAMGEVVGDLRREIADELGLPVVPVVAGANDQTVAALGAGLAAPGDAMLGMGTALVLYQVIEADAGPSAGYPFRGPYPGGLHWRLALCSTAGAVLDWVRTVTGAGMEWDALFREALSAAPGAGGLRLDPNWDAATGGALTGLGLGHARRHVFRAALEGIACAAREEFEMLGVSGAVRATGGGSANDGWMQLLADVSGRTFERLDQPHVGLWGTAIMAGHGAGLFDDMLLTARAKAPPGRIFTARSGDRGVYERVYEDYRKMRTSGAA